MGAFIDEARKYMWSTYIGTNSSDKGQCVGFFNKVVLDTTGVLYPIQGAQGAKDLITANNTRPDLCVQVKNDPKNPNQLPSIGDWVVWGATWGNGWGHVSCVESVSTVAFTGIEQNYTANTVTRQQHNWTGVIGWVHFYSNDSKPPVTPPQVDQTEALKAQIASLQLQLKDAQAQVASSQTQLNEANKQIESLTKQVNAKQIEIEALQDEVAKLKSENAELKAELLQTGSDSVNLNKLGEVLNWLITRLGLRKV